MDRTTIIESFKGAASYAAFLESFRHPPRLTVDPESQAVSEALYFQVCKLHYAGWRHRVDFVRGQKHAFADIFQDLVAFHLSLCLPAEYTLHLEEKRNKVRPDILVRKGDVEIGVVEVKTSIGFGRPTKEVPDPFGNRVKAINSAFGIPEENVVFVFETHQNVTVAFSSRFWDKPGNKPMARPSGHPYELIYPLFHAPDPYYWPDWPKKMRDHKLYDVPDSMMLDRAPRNIVSSVESVAMRILSMTI